MRRLKLIFVMLCMVVLNGCGGMFDYLQALKALRGTSYWTLQCSTYITTAKGLRRHCGAAEFWQSGCNGALTEVSSADSFDKINVSVLKPGDVIAFHGVHVAAYVGDGKFMDSDPMHNGVSDMTPYALPGDAWFTGKVKILRWKS